MATVAQDTLLFNPSTFDASEFDPETRRVLLATIDFFERKGKRKLKEDDRDRVWYADFLDFVKRERIFATLLTPKGYGGADCRWDTWRICEFNEILGFYGLAYWYTWQVSILGLGPIWMSPNEKLKRRAPRSSSRTARSSRSASRSARTAPTSTRPT